MSGLEFSPAQGPNPLSAAPGRAGSRRGKRSGVFWLMIGLLVLLALGAAGGGAAGFVIAAHRHPTQAQITAAGKREQAVLWERLSAGQIFPPSVGYPNALGAQTKATLVGIAPQARCGSAVDAKAAPVLAAAGCVTVLRATYSDASGTALATVGIAVLRSPAAATKAMSALTAHGAGGLLAVSFPGTVATGFTGKARETYAAQAVAGPYLFLYAAGYADGRSTKLHASSDRDSQGETVTWDLGVNVTTSLVSTLRAPPNPCKDKNIRC
jgi:hypothetical protein